MENLDCLSYIFSYLPLREREKCRQVCHNWLLSIDQMARRQHKLVIVSHREVANGGGGGGGSNSVHQPLRRYSFPNEYHHHHHRHLHHHHNHNHNHNHHHQYESSKTSSSITSSSNHNDCEQHHTIYWPCNFIRYQCYCLMLNRFPNLRSLCFEGIEHWNDHLIKQLIDLCSHLTSLAFIRCLGLGRSRMNESNYMNVTLTGWSLLVSHFGEKITSLTLRDCDIDDHKLLLIVKGFRQLKYLDIRGNRIGDAVALRHLCKGLQVLKVGPRLVGNVSADIPIESIVAGEGRFVTELYLQGFLSSSLSLMAQMHNLTKLTIRFMKPLLEEASLSSSFSAIGNIHTLQSLEIYQHNTHDCYMAVTKENLMHIFIGCPLLERFVLNCDIWCDSPLDDQTLAMMRRCCPLLSHVNFCPGNFQTTDQSLQILSSFDQLKYVRLVEFSGITQQGLVQFIQKTPNLQECIVEDCCDLNSQLIIVALRNLYLENTNRYLRVVITPLRSLQIPSEVIRLPESNPRFEIFIVGQKDRSRLSGLINNMYDTRKILTGDYTANLWQWTLSAFGGTLNTALTAFSFISTLLTFGAACFFYLFHLALIRLSSRFSVNAFIRPALGVQFLTTSMYLFLLASFTLPTLYLLTYVAPLMFTFNNILPPMIEVLTRINISTLALHGVALLLAGIW